MKSRTASKRTPPQQHPHLDHLFKVGVLHSRATDKRMPKAARREAAAELLRYSDEGRITQSYKEDKRMARKKTPAAPPEGATTFSGQGILFAIIDDREQMAAGGMTTIDVITSAIEEALDHGHETSEAIARYLTTSAFQHVPDKRVRFNSVLKAGDVVGAQITRKLYNSYNELSKLADEEQDPKAKADLRAEARGFAEAIQIVISPFSSEDPKDPRLVNWDEVDRMTEAFEKEQRFVRRDRAGNPQ